jgi:hypothetical protein
VAVAGKARHTVAPEVTVTVSDTKLVVSHGNLHAGPATFVVVNKGSKLHDVTINGPGLKNAQTRRIAPGKSAKLSVTLRVGAYMLLEGRLGVAKARWVMVSPAVASSGSGRVVQPFPDPAPMDCD